MTARTLGGEVLASLVVFLVALPLCMGVAVASGVPPAMGLVSGIVGGLLVGSIAGAPLQVSGPAAGLVVLVVEIVEVHGLGGLSATVLLAGGVQIAAGRLGLGQWFRAIAPAVIYGMLSGIGILIAASQFHVMVDDVPQSNGIINLATIPSAVVKGLTPMDGSPHHLAGAIGVLTLISLVGWNGIRGRLPGGLSSIPAALVAVGVASGVAGGFALPIQYVDVPGSLSEMVRFPALTDIMGLAEPALLGASLALALVASAESLLCAAATDKLHQGARSDLNQELVAQGVGNILCGALGALPVTGVIVRSTANIESGGKTRLSAILHGAWLLLTIVALPGLLNLVPVASLAAVLVYIGYKLVNPRVIRELAERGRVELGIYVATVLAIVSTNLLEGLLVGLALSVLHLAWTFSHLEVRTEARPGDESVVDVHFAGSATFVGVPTLLDHLSAIADDAEAHIHVHDLDYIDHACLEAIDEWADQRAARGGTVVMAWDELEARSRGRVKPAA